MRPRELQRRLRLIERLRGLVGRRVLDEDDFRSLHRGLIDATSGQKPISERQVRELERLVIERDRGAIAGALVDEIRQAVLAGRRVPWPTSVRDAASRERSIGTSRHARRRMMRVALVATVGMGAVGAVLLRDEGVVIDAGEALTTATLAAADTTDSATTSTSFRSWAVVGVASEPPTTSAATTTVTSTIATTTTRFVPTTVTNSPAGVTTPPAATSPPTEPPTAPPTTAPKPCPVGVATIRTTNVVKTKLPVTPGVPATEDRFAVSVDVVIRNAASSTTRARTVLVVTSDYEGAAPVVLQADVAPGATRTTTKRFELYASGRAVINVGLENTTITYRCNGSFA